MNTISFTKNLNKGILALLAGVATTTLVATADDFESSKSESESSSIQSSARPYGLSIVGKVQEAGSDKESKTFQRKVLPNITELLGKTLGERQSIDDAALLLDPSKLKLKNAAEVRVYFAGEGASYANSLGFTTDGSGKAESATAKLIFPNASSAVSSYDKKDEIERTSSEPLLPGDFVDLGEMKASTALDFFLIANGAKGGRVAFSTQKSVNPDGINHVVSFAYAMKDSPYLVLGFEDLLGGGDRDFNDVLIVVDIGEVNVAELTATPEPETYATMGTFLGLGWMLLRRRQNSSR